MQMFCGKFEIWLQSSRKYMHWNKDLGVVTMSVDIAEVAMDW